MAVGVGEGSGHVGADLGGVRCRQRSRVAKERGQRLAVNELHHDEVGAGVLAPVEDRDDVGVREVGGRLGLTAEALDEGAVDGELREEDLEGDRAVEQAVPCAVDLRHPTSRDEVGQLVAVREDARGLDGVHGCQSLRRARAGPGPSGRPLSALLASTASNRSCIVTSRPAVLPPPRAWPS